MMQSLALGTMFRQLPAGMATRLACARVARRLLDRFAIGSYSQTGEDRIIEALVSSTGAGFYVEVGSNDPVRFSNTFSLYQRGWRGVVVDANATLIARHHRVCPRDVCVHAVVSDTRRRAVFTEFEDPLVSSLDPEHVDSWSARRRIVGRHEVETETLTDLLRRHEAPHRFDLLSVDVEGHDLEVLRSLDLGTYRPRLLVIEMHDFDLARTGEHPVVAHATTHGYRLVGYAVANGYFLDAS